MKYIKRVVISKEDFPQWVVLTPEILKTINEDSDCMLPWLFCCKNIVKETNASIAHNYPTRELFIFAYREDSDDAACFERSKPGKVVIVHDWEEPGFEAGPEFVSFDAWYKYTLNSQNGDHDYDDIPGIDYYP